MLFVMIKSLHVAPKVLTSGSGWAPEGKSISSNGMGTLLDAVEKQYSLPTKRDQQTS
jgi:hypothetical protein